MNRSQRDLSFLVGGMVLGAFASFCAFLLTGWMVAQVRKLREEYHNKFYLLVAGLLLEMVLITVLFWTNHRWAAGLISNPGTLLYMLAWLAYIVYFDSKKRWPGVSAAVRASRILTFYRGEK